MGRDSRLVVVSRDPFNAETPLDEQIGVITPNPLHYVRSHFADPDPPDRLVVDGAVASPLLLTMEDVCALPSRSAIVTLECAGNGRAFLDPPAPGEPWRLGAVGTAEWTGVPLQTILGMARPWPRAVELLFRGADEGVPKDVGQRIAFERSLPTERAWSDDVLLAYAMNGEPLPPDHGAPLRLVVPGEYGMASVKWLVRITAVEEPFRGFYQADRYVVHGAPLGPIEPRAVITSPRDGGSLPLRPLVVRGYCWSGTAAVERVEVSVDGGGRWGEAQLGDPLGAHAWRPWRIAWPPAAPGEYTIVARAIDAGGRQQPLEQRRNDLGYANNAARPVRVRIC